MHSTPARITDTQAKAFRINLDPSRYGSFAEIGAGQEVVRWFFRVGGAARVSSFWPIWMRTETRSKLSSWASSP